MKIIFDNLTVAKETAENQINLTFAALLPNVALYKTAVPFVTSATWNEETQELTIEKDYLTFYAYLR